MHERTMAAAAEQGQGIPTQCSGALCPATGAQELVAVSQELAPAVQGDVSWWAIVAETGNTVDPTGGDARCNFRRWGGDERSGLLLQPPEPLAIRSESVANRLDAEGLFCSFERFRMGDALTVAEQPCVSGRSLELRYKYATLGEPLLQELFREPDGIGAADRGGLASTQRGSWPRRDDPALIRWQMLPPSHPRGPSILRSGWLRCRYRPPLLVLTSPGAATRALECLARRGKL